MKNPSPQIRILVSSNVWLQNDSFLFIFLDWRNSNELGHFLRSQLDELSWTLVLLFLQQRGWMHLWTCFAKLLKNAGTGVALASWEDQTLVSFPQAYHHNGTKIFTNWISIKLRHCEKATKFEKISHLFWHIICNVKFLWPFQKTWTLHPYDCKRFFRIFSFHAWCLKYFFKKVWIHCI